MASRTRGDGEGGGMSVSKEGMLEFLNALCEESSINFLSARNQYKVLAFRRLVDDVERWKQEAKSIIAESDQDIIDGFDTTNDYYLRLESFVDEFQNYTYGGKEEK